MTRRSLLVGAAAALGTVAAAKYCVPAESDDACGGGGLERPQQQGLFFFDRLGLIVQQDGDGGDTAQREGMYWLAERIYRDRLGNPIGVNRALSYDAVMAHLESPAKTGIFRRHPSQKNWCNPGETSRDQVVPLIAAMSAQGDAVRLGRFVEYLDRHLWFVNKDTMLGCVQFIHRAQRRRVVAALETTVLSATVSTRMSQAAKDKDDVGDDLNLVVQLLMPVLWDESPEVRSIGRRYMNERPVNYGMYLTAYRREHGTDWNARNGAVMRERINRGVSQQGWQPDCPSPVGALRWYFRAEQGGSPALAELYAPILEHYFRQ